MNAWTARRPSSVRAPFARRPIGRRLGRWAGAALSAWVATDADAQLFTPGNLVLSRVNSFENYPTNPSGVVTLMEYTTAGVFTGATVTLPIAPSGANHMCTINASNVREGLLTRSLDARYLVMGGYDVEPGWGSVSTSTFARVIGRVDSAGHVDTTTALTNVFSGASIRAVCSPSGSDFWLAGGSQGVAYAALGATTGTIVGSPGPTDTLSIHLFGDGLYAGSLGSYGGVSRVGPTVPPAVAAPVTLLPGMSGVTTEDFFYADVNTLYIATGDGIQKWTLASGWSFQYTISAGLNDVGLHGLAGRSEGSGRATLYATTDEIVNNHLVSVTDTGPNSTFTTLAFCAGAAFRGVAFAPEGPIPPTGACCIAGTCSVMTAAACGLGVEGVYFGDNVPCSSVTCAGPTCYPNCDYSTTSPFLNVLDFACFLNKYAAGNTYANCDGSTSPPVLNVLDFSCYLNKYATGCTG